jgi:hypothetical protein
MSLTPARPAAGALGAGYALPTAPLPTMQQCPTMASILASMSPETRAYTKAIMSLTFAQPPRGRRHAVNAARSRRERSNAHCALPWFYSWF